MTIQFKSKSKRTNLSTQKLPTIPTIEAVMTWDEEKVLRWIRQRDPNLLEDDRLENFNKECIRGRAFLASDVEFYQGCGLPRGIGLALKDLADEVKGEVVHSMSMTQTPANSTNGKLPDQTASRKRKGNTIFNIAYGQPANNITGDEADASESSVSPKRNRMDDSLSEVATRVCERRKRIREAITDINGSPDQHSNSVDPFPNAVNKLSDPTFNSELPFPSVSNMKPDRFKRDNVATGTWKYMGRTKFEELLEALKKVRTSDVYDIVLLYGTQGYGKSHLLAALVCYLAAQDERVVYIPDFRAWLRDPVGYTRTAMLFAWADDITTQNEIMTLNTEEEIAIFFESQRNQKGQKDIIIVGDQLNALTGSDTDEAPKRMGRYSWLMRFTFGHTTVFSSSANYKEYLSAIRKQTSWYVLKVYGGLDRVSHRKIMSQ
jgi:hypothetical protein